MDSRISAKRPLKEWSDILTKRQEQKFIAAMIIRLSYLTEMHEIKELLNSIEIAKRTARTPSSVADDTYVLFLKLDGLYEHKRGDYNHRDEFVKKEDFDRIVRRYKLTPEMIEDLICRLEATMYI